MKQRLPNGNVGEGSIKSVSLKHLKYRFQVDNKKHNIQTVCWFYFEGNMVTVWLWLSFPEYLLRTLYRMLYHLSGVMLSTGPQRLVVYKLQAAHACDLVTILRCQGGKHCSVQAVKGVLYPRKEVLWSSPVGCQGSASMPLWAGLTTVYFLLWKVALCCQELQSSDLDSDSTP